MFLISTHETLFRFAFLFLLRFHKMDPLPPPFSMLSCKFKQNNSTKYCIVQVLGGLFVFLTNKTKLYSEKAGLNIYVKKCQNSCATFLIYTKLETNSTHELVNLILTTLPRYSIFTLQNHRTEGVGRDLRGSSSPTLRPTLGCREPCPGRS